MKISPKFQEYLDRDYKNLDIDIDRVEVSPPPTDDSHSTRMELEELETIIAESKLPKKILKVADRSPLHLFYALAKKRTWTR